MPKAKPFMVMSFHTTTEAMTMQQLGKEQGLLGRLAPIPRKLSAGCGLAWLEPAENEATLKRLLSEYSLEYEQLCRMDL